MENENPATIRFPASHKKDLKIEAARLNTTMEDLILEAYLAYSKNRQDPKNDAKVLLPSGEKHDTSVSDSKRRWHSALEAILESGDERLIEHIQKDLMLFVDLAGGDIEAFERRSKPNPTPRGKIRPRTPGVHQGPDYKHVEDLRSDETPDHFKR